MILPQQVTELDGQIVINVIGTRDGFGLRSAHLVIGTPFLGVCENLEKRLNDLVRDCRDTKVKWRGWRTVVATSGLTPWTGIPSPASSSRERVNTARTIQLGNDVDWDTEVEEVSENRTRWHEDCTVDRDWPHDNF